MPILVHVAGGRLWLFFASNRGSLPKVRAMPEIFATLLGNLRCLLQRKCFTCFQKHIKIQAHPPFGISRKQRRRTGKETVYALKQPPWFAHDCVWVENFGRTRLGGSSCPHRILPIVLRGTAHAPLGITTSCVPLHLAPHCPRVSPSGLGTSGQGKKIAPRKPRTWFLLQCLAAMKRRAKAEQLVVELTVSRERRDRRGFGG